jgi:hypothetical protein
MNISIKIHDHDEGFDYVFWPNKKETLEVINLLTGQQFISLINAYDYLATSEMADQDDQTKRSS